MTVSKYKLIIILTIIFTFAILAIIFALSQKDSSDLKFPKGKLRIIQGRKKLEITIEIADTEQLWQYGLMYRKNIPWNFGMLFVFPDYVDSGFWMKNTLIPLNIAFIDSGGKILNIQEMEPCKEENCEIYKSPFPYKYALEVRKGFFKKFGFVEGAKVEFWYKE